MLSPATRKFLIFGSKFLLIFGLLYFGTLAVIGLAAPGGLYSGFIDHYFDYVSGIKYSLMYGTKVLLSLFDIHTINRPEFVIKLQNGTGVVIAMNCVGYGVMSFWAAYVISSGGGMVKILKWLLFGLTTLWIINVIRISLLLVAHSRLWRMPLGLNHHTWFNIAAYIAIFTMMYFFERSTKSKDSELTIDHRP